MAVSIHERVADAIRETIVRGEYPPGAGLSEVALSDELGVSRTPVREALKQLAAEGLVRVVPRVGTFVAEPTRRDVVELFQLRETFEGLGARLCAQRGVAEELEPHVADDGFHAEVVRLADSAKLAQTYRWHMNQLAAAARDPREPAEIAHEHRAVLALIASKDADGAELAMRDHVRGALRARMRAVLQ
jgi:DNA-binding GntR family transcriptional regulator